MTELQIGERFHLDIAAVPQAHVNGFGALMGTNGRIHTDPEFAKTTPLKGPVVQGGLVIAPLHGAMCCLVGEGRWLRHGKIDAKFISFTRPDDAARLELKVEAASDSNLHLSFSVTKADGTKVVVGDVHVGR